MTERVFSASSYERRYGFCRGVRIGNRIEVSGTAPIPQDGSAPPDTAFEQMVLCGDIAAKALAELDASIDDVVRTRMFITAQDIADAIGAVHGEVFVRARPAATMVIVAGLLDPRWVVEVEAEAIV